MPERIGRYPVVKELGRGGFATVYLAEDRSLDDLVAIKLLSDTYSNDPDIVARFIAEARVMRELAAPGLVTVYDSGEHEGQPFFVMEYCRRGTLSERLEQLGRPITVEEGYGLAQAMGDALSGVHRARPPVVHRDLKPGNLLIRHTPRHPQPVLGALLGADEELIVGDFGLAKIVSQGATQMSLIAYTRGYASPEQVRGDPTIDTSADVYSAAAVITSAMTGVVPEQVFVPEQQAFPPEVLAATGPLRAVLERSLSYERGYRPTTMNQWSEFLTMQTPRVEDKAPGTRLVAPPASLDTTSPSLSEFPPPTPRIDDQVSAATELVSAPEVNRAPPGPATVPPVAPAPNAAPPPAFQQSVPQPPHQPIQQPPHQPIQQPLYQPGQHATPRPAQNKVSTSMVRRLAIVGVGAIVVAVAAAFGILQLTGSGPAIVGPSVGQVGDEYAFAVSDASVISWEAGGQTTDDAVIRLTPTSPGSVTVTVETDNGSSSHTFDVLEPSSALRIVGPGHLPIGELTVLSVEGADGQQPTWTLDGADYQQDTLEVRPTVAGTLLVQVSAGGSSLERTFTIAPAPS